MQIQAVFLWEMTSCDLIGGYQHFGETFCLHLQDHKLRNNLFCLLNFVEHFGSTGSVVG
jgi:hypothetical protein